MRASLQEAFPRYAYSVGSLRRTAWMLFTGRGGFKRTMRFSMSALLVAYAAFYGKVHDLNEKELHWFTQRGIWLSTLLCVSFVCCYCHIKLVYNFRPRLLIDQFQRCGTVLLLQVMAAMLFLGTLSIYNLLQRVQLASFNSHNGSSDWMWKFAFNSTILLAVMQGILSTVFICIALPVAKRWVGQMKPAIKCTLMELLPWTLFLMILNCRLLLPSQPLSSLQLYKDGVYIMGVGFHFFYLLWLLSLTVYAAYDLVFPCKVEQQMHGKRKLAHIKRVYINYPSKSEVVTGLSPRHYALRYKGFQSSEEQEKEMKARLKTTSVVHEQYRIYFSQLD